MENTEGVYEDSHGDTGGGGAYWFVGFLPLGDATLSELGGATLPFVSYFWVTLPGVLRARQRLGGLKDIQIINKLVCIMCTYTIIY